MKEQIEYLQAVKFLDDSLRMLAYFRKYERDSDGQGMLDSLRLVYKRVGQTGKALSAKLAAEFEAG